MSVSRVFASAIITIEAAASLARTGAATEATDGAAGLAGNVRARGKAAAKASMMWTFGRAVDTVPGSEASENDQPPPTARSGRWSVSAVRMASAMSCGLRGKNARSATYAWVFDQF